jgi:hypothetical protein
VRCVLGRCSVGNTGSILDALVGGNLSEVKCVGLTPTDVQRPETRSLVRLIPRPNRGRQPTDGCGPPVALRTLKGGEGLGDPDDEVR